MAQHGSLYRGIGAVLFLGVRLFLGDVLVIILCLAVVGTWQRGDCCGAQGYTCTCCRNTLVLFVTGSSPDRLIGLLPYGNHVDLSRLLSHMNIEGCGWLLDASCCLGGCQREIEVYFLSKC